MENNEFLIRESGTHYTIRLPVEGHDLVVMVDKETFMISIPYWEYMNVHSVVKIIAQLCKNKELLSNPVVSNFLKLLQQPENKDELTTLQASFRNC